MTPQQTYGPGRQGRGSPWREFVWFLRDYALVLAGVILVLLMLYLALNSCSVTTGG